jgi:hypothetical protein
MAESGAIHTSKATLSQIRKVRLENERRKRVEAQGFYLLHYQLSLLTTGVANTRHMQERLAEAMLEIGELPDSAINLGDWEDIDDGQDFGRSEPFDNEEDDGELENVPAAFSKYFQPASHSYVVEAYFCGWLTMFAQEACGSSSSR